MNSTFLNFYFKYASCFQTQLALGEGNIFKKIYFIDFLQRGRERDRELETSMREKHQPAASCTPPTEDVPATNVHALDWNRTWDLSVHRPMLYPLSQTGFSIAHLNYIYIHVCLLTSSVH